MLHLFHAFWETYVRPEEYKVLILGTENVGKTTMLEAIKKFSGLRYLPKRAILPTVGFNTTSVKHMNYCLRFWDVGGRASLRLLWSEYYSIADALVWVLDGSYELASADSASWCLERAILKDVLHNIQLDLIPVIFFVNIKSTITSESANDTKSCADSARTAHIISCLQLDKIVPHKSSDKIKDRRINCEGITGVHGFGNLVYCVIFGNAQNGLGIPETLSWVTKFLALNAYPR